MEPDPERARIQALPAAHFQPLLDLLPQLRDPLPALPPCFRKEADGTVILAPQNVEPVDAFIQLCYALQLVFPCDWNSFVQEHPFHAMPRLIDRFDRFQCCQAITALVRGDRFTDGLVDGQWRNGNLARLVERLAEAVGE